MPRAADVEQRRAGRGRQARLRGICLLVVTLGLTLSAVPATGAAVTVSEEYKISTTTVGGRVSIAWNGTNYFAVWVDGQTNVVLGALIQPAGGVVSEVTVLSFPAGHGSLRTQRWPGTAQSSSSWRASKTRSVAG